MRTYKYLERVCKADIRFAVISDILLEMNAKVRIREYIGGLNILVNFGCRPYRRILLAHHDIVPSTIHGANDNTASVAELLELTHQLIEEGYDEDLTIAFVDQEESIVAGFEKMGSTILAKDIHTKGVTPEMVVVLDVCGIGDTVVLSEHCRHDPLEDRLKEICKSPLVTLPTPPSDNTALAIAGIPSTLICTLPKDELDRGPRPTWKRIHSKEDNLASIQWSTLKMMVNLLKDIAHDGKAAGLPKGRVNAEGGRGDLGHGRT